MLRLARLVSYTEDVCTHESTAIVHPGVAPPAFICGGRVTLRHVSLGFSEEEIARRYRWGLDRELQYLSGSIPTANSLADFRHQILATVQTRETRRDHFAVLDERRALIGIISYYNIVPDRGQAELGIYIGERDHWDRGYGSEATVLLLDYLFRHTTLQMMYLSTYADNLRAQACYRKVGFEVTSIMRKYSARAGYYTDVQMKVIRSNFVSIYPRPQARVLPRVEHNQPV